MYFSNATVNGMIEQLPELFNYRKSDDDLFKKRTKIDEDFDDGTFPVEPVLWGFGAHNAQVVGFRGAGAIAMVVGTDDGLIVKLNVGDEYPSFLGRRYLQATTHAVAQSGTVLGELGGRTLWPTIADGVSAPKIGRGTDADFLEFVGSGAHVEDVAARLVALALEHSLVKFTQRTRIRNAAASYWCTGKYRSDGIVYSLQNVQAISQWASPGAVGQVHDPQHVIWVGDASRVHGMSLLSRIMDVGGPLLMQESYLLKNFDAGRLLMVGTGVLDRDFASIEPAKLFDAIDEALWMLVMYNNLDPGFIQRALRLLIRNLPIVDMAHYREHDALYWRVKNGKFGAPVLGGGLDKVVDDAIEARFPLEVREAVGLVNDEISRGVLSDLFRRVVFSPPSSVDGLAPHTDHRVRWEVLGLLAATQGATMGSRDGVSVHTSVFDAAMPPTIPNVPAMPRSDFDDIMSTFSGRSGFHLFSYSQARDAAGDFVTPDGWGVVAAAPLDLDHGAAVPDDGQWLEWLGGNDANGVPYVVGRGLRAYVIRQWIPSTGSNYLNGYVAPPAQLRRYDVPATFRMGVKTNGRHPDLGDEMPKVKAYVDENARGDSPLDYLTEAGERGVSNLSNGVKSLALIRGLAYAWDAFGGQRGQNDAFKRWVHVNHAGKELTTVPDELMLFVGGVRSHHYTEACGGLWTLCYQKVKLEVTAVAGHENSLNLIKNMEMLASYILKLRCAVEMSDQMMRMSNARLVGCRNGELWPGEVRERMERGRVYQKTQIDNATYLARQALFLAALFDHNDSSIARTFGVTAASSFRLREPVVGKDISTSMAMHMNWLTPQTLRYWSWQCFYGVAAPTFYPDEIGKSWLRNAYFTSDWQDVDEEFNPGAMIHRWDEIWSAVLTGYASTDWYPVALSVVAFGLNLIVDVSACRQRHSQGYTQPLMRLNLPYEARLAIVTIRGNGHDKAIRPLLRAGDTGPKMMEGHKLFCSEVKYNGVGHVASVSLDPLAVGFENLELLDTPFASGGIEFGVVAPLSVIGDFAIVERSTGQFWSCVTKHVVGVAAGIAAGGQRLLQALLPIEPVAKMDDGGGPGVVGIGRVATDMPDVSKQANPGMAGVGDTPLVEVNMSSADTIMSTLSALSPEVKAQILNALAKDKPQMSVNGSVDSTASNTAPSTSS